MSRVPRLLPLLAVAIGGVLALKVVASLDGAPAFLKQAAAFAEEAPKPAAKKTKGANAKAPADPKAAKADPNAPATGEQAPAAADAATPATGTVAATPVCAASAADLAKEAGLSPAELRLLQSLQSRRGELDDRERTLQTQLAVLGAAEAKVDGKLKALTSLKGEIQGMLGQADQKQDAEVQRLVTVYSKMKPAEAAAIMIQLDDRVRIPVAAKMKETQLAGILAKMPPAEAKKITEKLAARFTPSQAAMQQVAAAENAKVTPKADTASAPAKAAQPRPASKAVHRKPRKAAAGPAADAAPAPKAGAPKPATAQPAAAAPPKPAAPKPVAAKPLPPKAAGPSA
jgi:flagellar motility protein MotE (MotC chaperone)